MLHTANRQHHRLKQMRQLFNRICEFNLVSQYKIHLCIPFLRRRNVPMRKRRFNTHYDLMAIT